MDQMEIAVAVAVGLVTIVLLYLIFGRKASRRPNILLTGVCDSGKTLMFSQLVYETFKQTHTSMQQNVGEMDLHQGKAGATIPVVDIPGHERLRTQFVEQYGGTARGLVFVIDSSTIVKEIKDVAEYLYYLLTDDAISSGRPPILIACNKQDLTLVKSSTVIQSLLEKELNTVRRTRTAALQGTDGTESARRDIGKPDEDFLFTHLPQKVECIECSCAGEIEELEPVSMWIESIAK